MNVVKLEAKLAPGAERWQPRAVARFNHHDIMVEEAQGEFVRRDHAATGDRATADDLARMPHEEKAAILWLDRFTHNPDRTARNPNLLWWNERVWLIDHGAALRFQYDWSRVTEETPREAGTVFAPHLFEAMASAPDWLAHDETCAARITREVIAAAIARVPEEFLRLERATYVAYLWKRVRAPRAFAHAGPSTIAPPGARGVPPAWLTRR